MIYLQVKFFFSLSSLYFLKSQNEPKLVYKSHTIHLHKNLVNTKKISNIIAFKKTYKIVYKYLMSSYLQFLKEMTKRTLTIFSLFMFIIQKDFMYHNLSYSLFFWSKPFNILFRMELVTKNKTLSWWVRYVTFKRRFLIIWRWLGVLLKFYKILYTNFLCSFYFLWKNFFLIPLSKNKLNGIKLKVYKVYLYKLF